MDIMLFAKLLRELLDSRAMSQKRLAEEANTTEATISRYLAGHHQPEITIVVNIAKAFKVSVDYLCGCVDYPTPKENLGAEKILLLKCYERADSRDKKTLWTVLERYMTDEEKESPISSSFEFQSGAKTG